MIRIIVVVLFIVAAIALVRYLRRQPAADRRALLVTYCFFSIIGLTVLLAVAGKIHWLGAVVAAMIPMASKLAVWTPRFLPLLQQWRKYRTYKQSHYGQPHAKSAMSYEEALALFGLTAVADKKQIIQRHRELMQKNHPDRGGSNYLAAKINEAKKILLAAIKQ